MNISIHLGMLTPRFVHQAVQYTSAIISLIGNGLLIVVVLHKTNRTFGSYRALLVAFACTDITISLVHAYVLPVYVQTEFGLVAFILDVLYLPPSIYSMVNVLTICLFYESFPLLTCHFIYRYLAVARNEFINKHFFQSVLASILISFSFAAALIYIMRMLENNANDHYFDEILLREYRIDMRSPYAPPMFHLNFLHSRNGNWNLNSLKAILYITILHIISLSVDGFCVWRILHELNTNFSLSSRKRKIHLQLCRTLIIQFTVPCAFCVLPFSFMALTTLSGHSFGQIPNLVGMLVSIFPAVDPYLVLFSLPKFRRIVIRWLAPCSLKQTTRVHSLN